MRINENSHIRIEEIGNKNILNKKDMIDLVYFITIDYFKIKKSKIIKILNLFIDAIFFVLEDPKKSIQIRGFGKFYSYIQKETKKIIPINKKGKGVNKEERIIPERITLKFKFSKTRK